MKKTLALILCALMALSVMTCAIAEEDFSGRTITVAWESNELNDGYQAQIDAFCAKYGCTVDVELLPGNATEAHNTLMLRAANGNLPDIFRNSVGAQLEDVDPENNLLPITDKDFVANIADAYIEASRAANGELYVVPSTTSNVAGVFYNKNVLADLGIEIPETWDEFLETCAWIRENTDMDPVFNPYDGGAGKQITYLSQYFYIYAEDPDFVPKYMAQEIDLHDSPALMRGLQKIYDLYEKGYQNDDPLSASLEDAALALCEGTAAFVICRTNIMTNVEVVAPECYNDLGFFPVPDASADVRGVAVWMPTGWVASKNTEDEELAMKFLEFMSTPEAVAPYCEVIVPTGAFMLNGIELPETVSVAVREAQSWLDIAAQPVMEYVCPIKGVNLAEILGMCGTGELTPDEAIEQIEADFRMTAEQLGYWE